MRRRRSHAPTLLTLAERTLRQECGLAQGDRVLVAVSGGGDSQALLHVLARLAPQLGVELRAMGVDHGLRPEATEELDLAEELARASGIPFQRERVRVETGGNLMARARTARYAALRAGAAEWGSALIATAHHADDRAETVLARLLRGAGPRGLAVMPPRSKELLRPFIRARRTDVQAHLSRHSLRFATDPTNSDARYLRTRLRLEVLPLLESLSPSVVEHLNALADQVAGPPPPEVTDSSGQPIPLGRAQVGELQRLLTRVNSRGSVRVAGGRSIHLDAESGALVVLEPDSRQGAVKRTKSD